MPVSCQTTLDEAINELDLEEQKEKERLSGEQETQQEKQEQELKRKQEAERNARVMTSDELELLQAAHKGMRFKFDFFFIFFDRNFLQIFL